MSSDLPIGIFDSGVGGLTVLRAVRERLPAEHLLYLGDTARVPYGNKAPETVGRYSLGCARLLVERGIKALVVACNTASAFGLARVRAALDPLGIPVLGVIDPVARAAVEHARTAFGDPRAVGDASAGGDGDGLAERAIGVIGTRGTVSSGAYPRAIHALAPDMPVIQVPSPLLVPLAEEGWVDDAVTREVAMRYLSTFADTPIASLILGCTHYPILRAMLADALRSLGRRDVAILDSASATADALEGLLAEHRLARARASEPAGAGRTRGGGDDHGVDDLGRASFCVTDMARFAEVGALFLGHPLAKVEHVDLR